MLTDDNNLVGKFDFLKYMPGYLAVKDINSKYCGLSSVYAKMVGWHKTDQAIHKTDYDFPCEAANAANLFVEADQKVISLKKAINIIEIYHCALGLVILLDNKIPLIDSQNKVVGVSLQIVNITDYFLKKYQKLYQSDKKFISKINAPKQYFLTPDFSPLPISTEQQEVLALLIRSKSMKEIACMLNTSRDKIDTCLTEIMNKLNCDNTSQLIEKAIASGFLFHLPDLFFNQHDDSSLVQQDAYHSTRFTKRENQCIIYLLQHMTAKEIGFNLGISYRTVETHLENIKIKAKASNRADLVRKLNNYNESRK